MALEPKPVAVGLQDVVKRETTLQDPVVDVPETKTFTLEEPAAKDVEAQQQGVAWDDVLAGNVTQLGDMNINSRVLDYVKTNPEAMVALRGQWAKFGQAADPEQDVIIPFTREGEVVVPEDMEEPLMKDAATRYAESRIEVDTLVSQYVADPSVRQIFVDQFQTGNFYESLARRLSEAGQFLVTGIPMAGIMSYNAAGAYADSKSKGTSFSSEWAVRGPDIQRSLDSVYKTIDKVIPNPTMKMAFNSDIHDEFKRQLDNQEITLEQYNERAMEEIDGELRPKEFITEEGAANLIDLAFNKLPTEEKFGVMFLENVIGMTGPGAARGASQLRKIEKLTESYKGTPMGKLLEGVDDPFEAVAILEKAKVRHKINLNALSIGVSQQKASKSMARLNAELRDSDLDLDALIYKGVPKTDQRYVLLEAKRQNLIDRKMRANYTLKAYPYVKQNVEDALILSAAQLGAREYLTTAYDMDPMTAEAVGLLSMALGGASVTRWTGGKVQNFVTAPRVGVGGNITSVADFLTFGKYKGFRITDTTLKDYEAATGVALSAEQRKAINYSIRLINNTKDQAAREKIFKALDDYTALQDRIVGAFPEELQGEATELFTQSFAQASALGPMAALHSLSINKIDAKNLKKMDATYMTELMEQADSQVRATELALDNFQNFLNASGNIADREGVQAMLDNTRNATAQFKRGLDTRSEETLALLGDVRKQVLSDPTMDIPEGFLEDLVELDVSLKTRLGQTIDVRTSIGENLTDIYSGIVERVDSLKSQRGKGKGYTVGLSRTMEDVFDAHLESMHTTGKNAYNAVREAAKTAPPIDMHDAVVTFMDKAGETSMQDFFSPSGQFFGGRMGRITYKVFDDMVTRTVPQDAFDDIRNVLKSKQSAELVDGMTNLELAIEMQKHSDGTFRPFAKANAYEVDEMRRAIRDYAYGVRNARPELSREATVFASDVERLLGQDPATHSLLKQARITYRSEIGDRLRRGGTLRKLDDSRIGGEKVNYSSGDMTRYRYGPDKPITFLRPLSKKFTGALQGKLDDQQDIRTMIDDLATDWADRVDGENVFDLDSPAGNKKFQALQKIVSESVYADWIERATAVFEKTDGPASVLTGGYNFKNLADESVINDITTVKIKQGGDIREGPLLNLGDIYADQRDISRLLRESDAVKKKYKDFKDDFANLDSQMRLNATNNIDDDKDSLNALQRFTGEITPDQFYDQFVLNGSESKFDSLRDTFIPSVVQTGKSAEDAEAMFDRAIRGLVSKGFMNRGGLMPVEGMKMTALQGDKLKVRQFTSPQQMLGDVQDPENRKMLNAMLGEDHVEYLTDIADYLDRAAGSRMNVDGVVNGYSINEGLSRLYNISRGMVSPLYVTSEFAVRLAAQSGIEVMQLAAGNKDAARIINNMFQYPELVTRTDVDNLNGLLVEFTTTELARIGQRELPALVGEEDNETSTEEQ